jgi:thiol-disulfide isomerase/thioredoxin
VNQSKIALNLALTAIIGMGIWLSFHNNSADTSTSNADKILPQQLPSFSMQDTFGTTRHSSEWSNKIVIVNFWATWCPPCLEEMPELVVFQDQYSSQGVQVVGVAVDNLEQVKSFMELYDINFPVVLGQDDAIELGKKMGNRISALPYTAIFDRNGKTLYAQPGKISIDILERVVKPQLSKGSH